MATKKYALYCAYTYRSELPQITTGIELVTALMFATDAAKNNIIVAVYILSSWQWTTTILEWDNVLPKYILYWMNY